MVGNNNHIDNPLHRIDIDLGRTKELPPGEHYFKRLDQDFYDMMQQHDLNTIYICRKEDDSYNMYLGDQLLQHRVLEPSEPKYLMGINEHNEYVIYVQAYDIFTNGLRLEEVCKYSNPNDAVAKLHEYKHYGDHTNESLKIYQCLAAYIQKQLGINEAITHILAFNGYQNDAGLQYLNERALSYGVKSSDRDLPIRLKADLRLDLYHYGSIVTKYADIYDVFVLYNYFTDKKYVDAAEDEIDLDEPISRIISIIQS